LRFSTSVIFSLALTEVRNRGNNSQVMKIRRLFVVLSMAAVGKAQVLAPTGTLRATFLQTNPVQGRVDAKTGAVSGPAVDLTRELGRQLGVPVSVVGVPNARALIDSVRNHTADIGFLAFDPSRAADVDFSQVYSLSWSSYIVPVNSPLHAVADADRKGIRIGAATGDSPELYLSRNLKNAELKRYPSPPAEDVLRMLWAGEIDVWAANRQRLIEMAASTSNLRVLPDNYFAVRQAIIVPKGDRAALDAINRFLNNARDSGLIRKAIDRAGLTGAVDVAPVI
jgi:polar amino acid transport system substrate-binding protein